MREIVYQFSNSSEGINFFTTSADERDELLNTNPNFDFIGSSFLGADPANDDSSPVFGLFNESTGEYFYTISTTERDELADGDFVSQGEVFSAFETEVEGSTPIYRFENTDTGTNIFTPSETERQALINDADFQDEGIAFYTVPVAGEGDTPPSEDPIAALGTGSISGIVFSDLNRSGFRDSELVQGENPDLIFVIDVSGSTSSRFGGTPVGNLNDDFSEDSILDAELAGLIGLNEQLQSQGLGDNVEISIVAFGSSGVQLNMLPDSETPSIFDPETAEIPDDFEFTATPNTDTDDDGISDVEEILRSITGGSFGAGGGTNFQAALAASEQTFDAVGTSPEEGNIIFLSDGGASIFPEDPALVSLRNNNANISAFGVGTGSNLNSLRIIDPLAQIFTSTDEFLEIFGVEENDAGDDDDDSLSLSRLEPTRSGIQVYIDSNDNGVLDANEPVEVTDANGAYEFANLPPGDYVIRQVVEGLEQTLPSEGQYTIELDDDEAEEDINFGTAPIARDNFTGADIQVQAFSPDLNTATTRPITATVRNGVEFGDLPDSAIGDAELIDVDINVGEARIVFTVDELAADDDGRFDFAAFNGYRLLDISQSIAPITNVTVDPENSTLGVSDFNVNFNADLIEVDFSGVTYESGDSLILDVEFADDDAAAI
ncbi:MAG: hypothetical protein AAFQ41_03960 [Cyanobacteria bacterium J06623_7]